MSRESDSGSRCHTCSSAKSFTIILVLSPFEGGLANSCLTRDTGVIVLCTTTRSRAIHRPLWNPRPYFRERGPGEARFILSAAGCDVAPAKCTSSTPFTTFVSSCETIERQNHPLAKPLSSAGRSTRHETRGNRQLDTMVEQIRQTVNSAHL